MKCPMAKIQAACTSSEAHRDLAGKARCQATTFATKLNPETTFEGHVVANGGSNTMVKKLPCGAGFTGGVTMVRSNGLVRGRFGVAGATKEITATFMPDKVGAKGVSMMKLGDTMLHASGMTEGQGDISMKLGDACYGAVTADDNSGYFTVKKTQSCLKDDTTVATTDRYVGRSFG